MSKEDYVPRLSIVIRQDQYDSLQNLIDWGIRSKLFEPIIDDLITLLEKDRATVTAFLLERRIQLKDFLKGCPNGDS